MTCQNQAVLGDLLVIYSWKMIKLKKSEDYILKSTHYLKILLTFSKRETSNLRVNGRKV